MPERAFLTDVNVLIALSDPEHVGHPAVNRWYRKNQDARILLCCVTEAGFVRLAASPSVGGRKMSDALEMLRQIKELPSVSHLAMQGSLLSLVAPFAARLHGYRQVTDALLLGLAIENKAILVTLDRRIEALAGAEFQSHLLTLQ